MLEVGKKRAKHYTGAEGEEAIGFVEGNAESLPFVGLNNILTYPSINLSLL